MELPTVIMIILLIAAHAEASKLFQNRPLLLRIAYVGLADDNPADSSYENVTINYVGRLNTVNAIFYLHRDVQPMTKAVVTIRRCTSPAEVANCEYFQTWTFGRESCQLLKAKNMLWTPMFSGFQPPLICPFSKGRYDIRNASLDTGAIEKVFSGIPLDKYFWRIRIDAYDYKMFASIVGGVYTVRGKA